MINDSSSLGRRGEIKPLRPSPGERIEQMLTKRVKSDYRGHILSEAPRYPVDGER